MAAGASSSVALLWVARGCMVTTRISVVCPLCDWTKPVPHATRRSALIDLVLWDRDSTLLKMAAQPELRLLHELLTKLGEWQTAVRAVLAQPGFAGDAEAVAQRLLRQGLVRAVRTHRPQVGSGPAGRISCDGWWPGGLRGVAHRH